MPSKFNRSVSDTSSYQQRGPWQRSRSTPNHQQVIPKDPDQITISDVTRSKLDKLKFKPKKKDDADDADTETKESDDVAEKSQTTRSDEHQPDPVHETPPKWNSARRILKDIEEEPSPNDKLSWNTDLAALERSATKGTPVRNCKRAASSSPTQSPYANKKQGESATFRRLAAASKAHADPTLELWDRYALHTEDEIAGQDSPLDITELLVSSSPKTHRINTDPSLVSSASASSSVLGSARASGMEASLRRSVIKANGVKRRRVAENARASLLRKDESKLAKDDDSLVDVFLSNACKPSLFKESAPATFECNSRSSLQMEKFNLERELNRSKSDTLAITNSKPVLETSSLFTRQAKQKKLPEEFADLEAEMFDDDIDDDMLLGIANEQSALPQTPKKKKTACEFSDDDIDDDDLNLIFESTQAPPNNSQPDTQSEGHVQAQDQDQAQQGQTEDNLSYMDDLSGIDLDAAFASASAARNMAGERGISSNSPTGKSHIVQRMKIVQVQDSEYEESGQIVTLQIDRSETKRTAILRDVWAEPNLEIGLWAYVVGEFIDGICVVDINCNFFILQPDHLVSITTLADAFSCIRKAVLQDRVRATSAPNKALVYGTIQHEVFQEALVKMDFTPKFLRSVIEAVIKDHLDDLFTIQVPPHIAQMELDEKMAAISEWADKFISPVPKASAKIAGIHGRNVANMCISKLLDIEEHVWSPMYGLKGNIDATVQVTLHDKDGLRNLTVPFEVKTGKTESINHRAQTTMYTILLSDRYDIDINTGFLYYSQTGATKAIPAIRHELVHMMMKRNELSQLLQQKALPPIISNKNTCRSCFAKTECSIIHKLTEDGTAESSGFGDNEFNIITGQLNDTHATFFRKWNDLLTYEEKHSEHAKREIWSMTSADREALHRGFSNCIIKEMRDDTKTQRFSRYHYKLVKENAPAGFSFTESALGVGDPVVVSDEEGHFALAIGYVTGARRDAIYIAVDRRLHNQRIKQAGFNAVNNQVFAGINEVVPEGVKMSDATATPQVPVRYRLDKDEFGNGMARIRHNILAIMDDNLYGSQKVRELVVDLKPPIFKTTPTQYHVANMNSLNVDQQAAIQKVMSAKDYALVLGMPGTGKTTTIAHIIRALVAQKKSVLLTSYTHSAVDNILLKLQDDNIPILRIGNHTKVHNMVADFTTMASDYMGSFEVIQQAWMESPVVATTCLGISHALFSLRTFDYCIVDEASQITLPVCLGPIRMAETFVLVGDHYQLPPVVQNEQARLGGLDVSMFKLLSESHPDSVVNLEHQYRMCEDIMMLSNQLIYQGRLKCGTEELKSLKLDIPDMDALRKHHYHRHSTPENRDTEHCSGHKDAPCWLRDVISAEARARFLNTDALGLEACESETGSRIINAGEVQLVIQVVEALISVGVPAEEIGVMTHYRAQLALLQKGLQHHSKVELYTADRFQGRDKEVVVLSLVRSNEKHNIGDLLKDWRRINVAITRAKTKLLVVGSRDTTTGAGADEMVGRLVRLMDSKGWVLNLPSTALKDHFFEAVATQLDGIGFSPKRPAPRKHVGMLDAVLEKSMPQPRNAKVTDFFAKENMQPGDKTSSGPKRVGLNGRLLVKNRPLTRDVLNDLSGGGFS
ncbi:hypothetical protein TD95_001534 [Thielaviopsis punctulata]|uniref:DNA replication ATP-dependent helicase/nuclease DNA2 n=1 Tax=Thielaviopsis punctulata TaxID=72032 RepID=A0A0F4ZIU8_9PEZI|nr:hypothetical protein TD95_001534 [Thielaviopsis punctulata]